MKTLDVEMTIRLRRPHICMPHQPRKLQVADIAGSLGPERVAVAVKDELLAGLNTDFRTFSDTSHLPHDSVFAIRLAASVEKHMIAIHMGLLGQASADLGYKAWQRDDPGHRVFLSRDRLVLGDYPELPIEIHPFPNERSQLSWPAPSKTKSDKKESKIAVTVPEQPPEFIVGNGPGSPPRPRLLVALDVVLVDHIELHRPIENRLHDGKRISNCCWAAIRRKFPFDFRKVHPSQITNSERSAEHLQRPQKAIAVGLVRGLALARLNVAQEIVGEFGKRSVKPITINRLSLRLPFPNRFQLPARGFVILVKVLACAIHCGAPEAARGVKPRLARRAA